ncbi:MFS transporter [Flavobacterium sp. LAR06]|uniref:MFS transporter n=1 Tax=Flavobacterium sp. LAR06 TaxID=3064897 RepID=UPI0035BF32E3
MNQANTAIGKYRWTICGLVFFATTVNYLDRNVISYLRPFLAEAFHWTPEQEVIDYSNIELAFKIAYALGMLVAGGIIDKLGTKIGYAIATGLWSLAAIGHALATGTPGFLIARVFLGITEAGNFPAAIKATAEWFPQKERALATGIFNSGSNIGAIIVPLSVPFIAENYGWQWAFILTGIVGFVWLALWFVLYEVPEKQKRLSQAELEYINSDKIVATEVEDTEKVSWFKLLTFRQTWAFAIGKLLTDPVWWFYLFWLPDFLMKQYKLSATEIIWPCALVYVIGSVGSIGGGWLPLKLIEKNWPAYKARKTSMLIYAFAVLPVLFSQYLGSINMWWAILVIGFAVSAHQAWSANIFTTVSDMFPKKTTASVTGIGGMFGALGGILLTLVVQKNMFVYYTKLGEIETGYFIMFCICGASYLLAWLIMHILVPRMKKVEV